jgi:hypothetical protein
MPNKYRNEPQTIDNIRFASRKEADFYVVLRTLLRAGLISDLRWQVRYPLRVNGQLICTYVADFVHIDEHGMEIVTDVKGVRTREYITKKKLMAAIYGIAIREV